MKVNERLGPKDLLERYSLVHLMPEEFGVLCPSGFRRIVIADTETAYVTVQAFAAGQRSFAHTHPDSEEWVVVISGQGEARFGDRPIPIATGSVVGRGSVKPHAFAAGAEPLYLLSIQCPRPQESLTTWDETERSGPAVDCVEMGRCRCCERCGGHSAERTDGSFECENCKYAFD